MKHVKCLQIIDKNIAIINDNINRYEQQIKSNEYEDGRPHDFEQHKYLLKNVEYLTFQRAILKQVWREIMEEVNNAERNNEK